MRRALPALVLVGALLSAAACGTARGPEPGAPTGATPAAGAASADAAQAQTRALCETLGQVYSQHLGPFAEALSATVEGDTAARTETAQKEARHHLNGLADAIVEATRANPDTEVQADGVKTAEQLRKTSTDDKFFGEVKTSEDVNTVVGTTVKTWIEPVARHCS